jgi:putative ABC transport system permease protein
MKKIIPPKWANRFLEWYCRPDLLEEIQGDAYELFDRTAKENKTKANLQFIWNVFRFFRLKNIRRKQSNFQNNNLTPDMIKNIFKVAIRNFMRQPGHSFLNVFGLTSGFVCAFLIVLWVTHEYSYDKFHRESENIYKIITHVQSDEGIQTYNEASCSIDVSSIPEVEKLVSISTGTRWPHELCFRPEGKPNECIYLSGVFANENLFSVFNYPILQGDPNPLKGGANIAMSEKMAALLYGSTNPIGKNIKVDGAYEVTIASIFKDVPINSSIQFDFAMPYSILKKEWGTNDEGFNQNFFDMYVETNNVSASVLTEKLNDTRVLTEALKNQKISYQAYPLTDWHLKSKFEGGKNTGGRIEYVNLFIIIGLLVVIMAVINFVNMSTARATLRAKEIGIRKVTGAVRSTIAVQFMSEAFLIVFLAFVLSLIFTQLLLPFFNQLIGEPIIISILSGNMPLYLGGFLLAIALLAGIYPALVMSSFQPIRILKNQLSSHVSGSTYFRKSLLVVQLSVSIGIVIFSGVIYSQLKFIGEKDLGLDHKNLIHLEPTYKLMKNFEEFKTELLKNETIVNAVTSSSNPINSSGSSNGVSWAGKAPDSRVSFKTIGCSYGFPETMGLKIIDGKNFQSHSQDSLRTEVLITMDAAKVMGFTNPVGEEIKMGNATCVVIGVVNDFHTESLHESQLPVILFRSPNTQNGYMYVRYQPGKTKQAMEALNKVYNSFEPTYTMRYDFQDENYDKLYKSESIASRLIVVFTAVALIIAIIGLVGLATFNALRKTKELSIRRVFGASIVQSLALLFNEFLGLFIFASIVAGGVAWYAVDHWLQGFAYRTSIPWWIFISTFVGTGILILAIVLIQGLRTVSANPTKTLRSE